MRTCFAHGDAAGAAALYAETGQLLPIHSAPIRGRAAIQAFWQGCLEMGISAFHRQPTDVDLLGTTVNEVGSYTLCGRNGAVLDIGKYVVIWKQQAGKWQIHRDIWTSSLAATG